MEITKEEWNRYSWVGNNHWLDVRLQMEREPYACEISEIFLIVLVSFFLKKTSTIYNVRHKGRLQ